LAAKLSAPKLPSADKSKVAIKPLKRIFVKRNHQHNRLSMKALLYLPWFLLLLAKATWSAPSNFEPIIGNALLCQDEINSLFFQDYLTRHFKSPYKTEGGGLWYKPDGTLLFGSEVEQIFVSTGGDQVEFLGVIFNAQISEVKQKLYQNKGVQFFLDPSEKLMRSTMGSFLMEYTLTKTKLFCVKYRVGR
jgi:hypothetical protein